MGNEVSIADRGKSMSVKLYVGNLPYGLANHELEGLFERVGVVKSVNIGVDHDTGRSRGAAFVEMESAESAVSAIDALNGAAVDGRQISVSEAG
jgi:RNA recognition motif-containing protein